jgi:hypothetical protein
MLGYAVGILNPEPPVGPVLARSILKDFRPVRLALRRVFSEAAASFTTGALGGSAGGAGAAAGV